MLIRLDPHYVIILYNLETECKKSITTFMILCRHLWRVTSHEMLQSKSAQQSIYLQENYQLIVNSCLWFHGSLSWDCLSRYYKYLLNFMICDQMIFQLAGGWMGIYATIPIFSALINMATNKLAVWMIFSPLNFKGNCNRNYFYFCWKLWPIKSI